VNIFTLGFTQRSAADFFGTLRRAGIERVVDVRLHNTGQLAGFSKREDLAFFLKELCAAEYVHEPRLAPNEELLSDYRQKRITWAEYEPRFLALMAERRVQDLIDPGLFGVPTALLCSERTADRCHRRLVLEYLAQHWGDLGVTHL